MSMKRRPETKQASLWITPNELASSPGHPFYSRLNQILADGGFDEFVEGVVSINSSQRHVSRKVTQPAARAA